MDDEDTANIMRASTEDLVKKALGMGSPEYRGILDGMPPLYDPSWFPEGIGDKVYVPFEERGRETTPGTPVKFYTSNGTVAINVTPEPKPEPLTWLRVTIPEEDDE